MSLTEPAPQRTGPSLKGRALRLLALREHTRAELEQKLARHDPDPDELMQALDDLQAQWPYLHIKSDFIEKVKM